MALLLDHLQKPDADLGLRLPSQLEWRHRPDKALDHVVLGRGGPGGVWQSLAGSEAGGGDMLTVSLGGWMELPDLSMEEWQQGNTGGQAELTGRASVATVSQYYEV